LDDPYEAANKNNIPFWAKKLSLPSFGPQTDKEKFYKQWNQRKGLDKILENYAYAGVGGFYDKVSQKNEVGEYIEKYG